MSATKTLCVVPCGKAKIWDRSPRRGPTAARDVYTGSFASAARRYAERFHPGAWVILSAKHGLLAPDEIVAGPYEVSFLRRGPEVISDERLAEQVVERGLTDVGRVVVVAGRAYVRAVAVAFAGTGVLVDSPLQGVGGMGKMIAMLKAACIAGRPLPDVHSL